MKGMIKKIIVTTATAVMIVSFALPAYAGTKYKATCASPGCESIAFVIQCIMHRQYNIDEVNAMLYICGQPLLGN